MKILFLGDFLYDYDSVNEDVISLGKYFKDNNYYVVLNLEGSIDTGKKLAKPINLANNPIFIEVLKILNVKAVNLANNHIMDYCKEGLAKTIELLDKANIGHFGAGLTYSEAIKPYVIDDGSLKIALYGFGWNMEECIYSKKKKAGVAGLDFNKINKIISSSPYNEIIPIFHYGYEHEKLPQPYHLLKTRELKNNPKVKCIIGHHPHVVQAYEEKRNIFYSLGNFYFGKFRDEYKENDKNYENTSKGIGVVLDANSFKTEIIKFVTKSSFTTVNNSININNLINIDNIEISDYKKYFYKNNNIINKKYVYNMDWFHVNVINKTHFFRRTLYKMFLRKIKWPIGRKVKKILKGLKGDKSHE